VKFVLAPDKFKGSLTGIQFCDAVEKGIKSVFPEAEILKLPLADGGDGTIEILDYHLHGEIIEVEVKDPLFRPIQASYLFIKSSSTAFIEMAEASGMKLLSSDEQNCFSTTTYGTGELILYAIKKGAKNIILGIGGSATNDCGIGMASALGFKFLDKDDNEIIAIGKNLSEIKKIDRTYIINNLSQITFNVACDVTNPLYGKDGAAYVYAAQKGAAIDEIRILDQGLRNMATLFKDQFEIDIQNIKGGGAGGGMGAGAKVFLKANLISGIDLIKKLVDFDSKIRNADWIITGEGNIDHQTLSGKTIQGVIASAKKYNIPVAAFCGNISLTQKELDKVGISYTSSIIEKSKSLEDAMVNSSDYLKNISSAFIKKFFI
jgi:glycerate kinase